MEEVVANNWRSLIRPRGIERDGRSTESYGKFVIRPMERGYGTTIGNSLRRVLLSSLYGAAITSVRIEGVLHEFSSIPGVVEDVTDIILNFKGVRIRMPVGESLKASIDRSGEPGKTVLVRAGDLRFSGNAEVLNPDHVLATLTETGRFVAECEIRMGRGYVPGSMSLSKDMPIGTIPIDALHSPIRKVKYVVTNARVGRRTDYDKLSLEVWTDGSVRPEDALAYAAKIIKEQLQVFINFHEAPEPVDSFSEPETDWNAALFKRVDELELSVRSANCLQNAGIEYIYQLVQRTEDILAELDLNLGTKLTNFPEDRVR